jgi:hypothetical protein
MKILMVLITGILGGLVNSLEVWIFGVIGIDQALGFKMEPALTVSWLMPRLISSGLWGCYFFCLSGVNL